jgi:hypothetical protein
MVVPSLVSADQFGCVANRFKCCAAKEKARISYATYASVALHADNACQACSRLVII